MIGSFKDKRTEQLFRGGRVRGFPSDIVARARHKLTSLNAAHRLDDMRIPPSNRLEQLKADRTGQYSIRINNQWRICFRWFDGNAFDVEICDYH
ncbi:MAG: type II toxin-antitoxin system RelE/ParE family toxin [Alphaproteobacteria bacterium]|nr:type II toxin-antitoxin system RelE/ParE family toxin [Alphaproteobacteria bacterium]